MAIRDRVTWGDKNPFSDPRYADLDQYVNGIRQGRMPPNVKGRRIFENRDGDLPGRPDGYYTEYDVEPLGAGKDRGTYRIVLGGGGEVFVTGNHYRDFRQVINMPEAIPPNSAASQIEKARNEALAKLDNFRQRLQNQINLYRGEHKAEQDILTNTDSLGGRAIALAGRVTNALYNSPIPDLSIWDEAIKGVSAAQEAIKGRNVKKAIKALILARNAYLKALKQYATWKNGLEGAGDQMVHAIEITAAVAILAAVGAFAAAALAADATAAAATEQTAVRVAATVQRADAVLRVAEATSLAEEEAAEQELERVMDEFARLRGF